MERTGSSRTSVTLREDYTTPDHKLRKGEIAAHLDLEDIQGQDRVVRARPSGQEGVGGRVG